MHRALAIAVLFTALATPTVSASVLPPNFVETHLDSGFVELTGFTFLPDGRALLIEKGGIVHVKSVPGPRDSALVIPGVYTYGEAGLGGIAVDPGWPLRPFIYVHYCQETPEQNVLARYRATGDLTDPNSTNLHFSDPYLILVIPDNWSNHNGGCLRFAPDGMLFVSLGDDTEYCVAQTRSNLKGGIARIDVRNLPLTGGGPTARRNLLPSDNPFASDSTDGALMYCYGMRNPFRFNVDRYTGVLYVGDVGGLHYEEMDEVNGGENGGWPVFEADTLEGTDCGIGFPTYESPIVSYPHTEGYAAIIGGPLYRGAFGPYRFPLEYEDVVFYADYLLGFIRLMKKAPTLEWEPFSVPGQPDSVDWATEIYFMTDFQAGPGDALYYTTEYGEFYRIAYTGPLSTSPPPDDAAVRPLPRAYPNPFRSGTLKIEGLEGTLSVFDSQGRLVRRLEAPSWDGRNAAGEAVRPGAYWIRASKSKASARVVVLSP